MKDVINGKVAIYTWCNDVGVLNYGQTLQCYATQKYLNNLGIDSVVIWFRRQDDEDVPLFSEPYLRKMYEREYRIWYIEKKYDERIERFFKFIDDYIVRSIPCYNVSEVIEATKDCDIFLCGSDQLWNYRWFDDVCLFSYLPENKVKISYATSGILEDNDQTAKLCQRLSEALSGFKVVSVRETIAADLLEKYANICKPQVVLDPVFLLNRSEWDSLSSKKIYDEKYIFCFFLRRFTPHKVVARELAKRYDATKVVFIRTAGVDFNECIVTDDLFVEAKGMGPKEFISLIKNAAAIYTDSFHVCAFSLIFQRDFFLINQMNPGRIDDLLERLGTESRGANTVSELDEIAGIDYNSVSKKLDELQQASRLFLKDSIMTK